MLQIATVLFVLATSSAARAPQSGFEHGGDSWTDAQDRLRGPLWEVLEGDEITPRSCVNVCPTIACPRTCPEEGERWEIRIEYHDGVTGPATFGGCFGAESQAVCYQLTHIATKGVTEQLPAGDPRCAPGLTSCHRNILASEIKSTIGVRTR